MRIFSSIRVAGRKSEQSAASKPQPDELEAELGRHWRAGTKCVFEHAGLGGVLAGLPVAGALGLVRQGNRALMFKRLADIWGQAFPHLACSFDLLLQSGTGLADWAAGQAADWLIGLMGTCPLGLARGLADGGLTLALGLAVNQACRCCARDGLNGRTTSLEDYLDFLRRTPAGQG